MKVLIIEDAQEIVDAVSLCLNLRWPEAEVASASEGKTGIELCEKLAPDLIILDIGLPDMLGLDVLRALREISDVPIAMLTVHSEEEAIARYLEEGADEYVVKPFSHIEFIGRMQALIRRSASRQKKPRSRSLQAADLTMDFTAGEVYRAGQPISLTRTELALLEQLVRTATRVVTYETLASSIEREGHPVDSEGRLLRLHVRQLQSKLGDNELQQTYIANVIGLGYKFVPKVTSSLVQSPQPAASRAAEPPAEPQQTTEPVSVQAAPRAAGDGGAAGV